MTKRLNITPSDSCQNVGLDLLCLSEKTDDYIDGMSPIELAILKKKIKMAELLLDNGSEPIQVK
ncbi:hypothetical protein [Cardinium endosymbiont of Bemisia tabaci]|uniref:hypothetical protein n=1 Tax=Cardinium endosymbiont of Bemisia tabaci TaxID=672794 RepID=UPI000442D130|nr:hypothetical protein [Cardinium endosymbiont of Bemisia tabaci]CDG50176.1 Hypothetical protein CHV_h0012 [Cardinium endosymbiont cBtQ1 of Bemisia tabaci]